MTVKIGTGGGDYLVGTAGRDTLWGKDGNDQISGGLGADNLYGGDGDDTLYTLSNTSGSASDGHDYVNGGNGEDLVDFSQAVIAAGTITRIDLDNTHAGKGAAVGDTFVDVEDVKGTTGNDQIYGSSANNVFYATWGEDVYDGRDGIDRYSGIGAGDLVVDGQGGQQCRPHHAAGPRLGCAGAGRAGRHARRG